MFLKVTRTTLIAVLLSVVIGCGGGGTGIKLPDEFAIRANNFLNVLETLDADRFGAQITDAYVDEKYGNRATMLQLIRDRKAAGWKLEIRLRDFRPTAYNFQGELGVPWAIVNANLGWIMPDGSRDPGNEIEVMAIRYVQVDGQWLADKRWVYGYH